MDTLPSGVLHFLTSGNMKKKRIQFLLIGIAIAIFLFQFFQDSEQPDSQINAPSYPALETEQTPL